MPVFGGRRRRAAAAAAAAAGAPAGAPSASPPQSPPPPPPASPPLTPPRVSFEAVPQSAAEPPRAVLPHLCPRPAAAAGGASAAGTKVPVAPERGAVEAVAARVTAAVAGLRATGGGDAPVARGRGGGGGAGVPILVELAVTEFANGLQPPAPVAGGFVDFKGWLCRLVAPGMEVRWRDAVYTLSAHVRGAAAGGVAYSLGGGPGVDVRLLEEPAVVVAFCAGVTRRALGGVAGMDENRVSANAWRQSREADTPLNLFKIATFFVAWTLWNEVGSADAKVSVDAAVARVRGSSGANVDESGRAIVVRLSELYFDEHLLPMQAAAMAPSMRGSLVRVPTH